jgi:hypothetical protein
MGVKRELPPWVEHAMEVRRALTKKGFKPNDAVQVCENCTQYAEESWGLHNTQGMGGRSLVWCANCGRSRSWKGGSNPTAPRAVEEPFDLAGFLGLKFDK